MITVDTRDVAIRGNASAEDVAAVLAALGQLLARAQVRSGNGYDRWRAGRIAALRRHPPS